MAGILQKSEYEGEVDLACSDRPLKIAPHTESVLISILGGRKDGNSIRVSHGYRCADETKLRRMGHLCQGRVVQVRYETFLVFVVIVG